VIVDQIHIPRLAIFHSEDDPPIGSNGDRPKALEIALERMKVKARNVHVFRDTGPIETLENTPDLLDVSGIQQAAVVLLEKFPQPLVAEARDDARPV
jgi:hypothetical protein